MSDQPPDVDRVFRDEPSSYLAYYIATHAHLESIPFEVLCDLPGEPDRTVVAVKLFREELRLRRQDELTGGAR